MNVSPPCPCAHGRVAGRLWLCSAPREVWVSLPAGRTLGNFGFSQMQKFGEGQPELQGRIPPEGHPGIRAGSDLPGWACRDGEPEPSQELQELPLKIE